ncbi:Transcriptional activator [Ancistrocladus abbreviatus]
MDFRFHVFGIGQRSLGFSVQIEVKAGPKTSKVVVGPNNRTAISNDNFLRVNLIGDFVGYTNIPSFEDFYLVTPRQGGAGQPQDLGSNFSMWMLLERVRFTLDGLECNKIGASYEAFNGQPDFCSSPFWSCLHNQLWNFHEDAGPHSFSIGITEVLNTNLLIELRADDIEYVYQKSPGKILGIMVPTFEALAQFGIAKVTAKNIGEVEASYSLTMHLLLSKSVFPLEMPQWRLQACSLNWKREGALMMSEPALNDYLSFDCSRGVPMMEEQFFIMKPKEIITRSFKLYLTTDQAAKYACSAILKDSEFNEVDRAECQFTTTATVLDNGTQITPFEPPKATINGFFDSIVDMWNRFWEGFTDFITGKSCRSKCSSFFDFHCHIQYVCMSWLVLFGLFLAIFPTVLVLIWLLHQKGLFDPLYDWWEDHCWEGKPRPRDVRRYRNDIDHPRMHHHNHKHEGGHHRHDANYKHRRMHTDHGRHHLDRGSEFHHHLHHVHRDKHKHRHRRSPSAIEQYYLDREDIIRHHQHRKERKAVKRSSKLSRHGKVKVDELHPEMASVFEDNHSKLHFKRREQHQLDRCSHSVLMRISVPKIEGTPDVQQIKLCYETRVRFVGYGKA